jgi:hypothetical protein
MIDAENLMGWSAHYWAITPILLLALFVLPAVVNFKEEITPSEVLIRYIIYGTAIVHVDFQNSFT